MAVGGQLSSWKHGTHGATSSLTDFSLKTMDVNLDRTSDQLDATCFQATYRAKEQGFKDGNLSINYHFDPTVYIQITDIFNNNDTVDFELGPDGTTTGKVKITGSFIILKVGTPVKVNEVLVIPVSGETTGAVTDALFS
jgi:hypothetical protein